MLLHPITQLLRRACGAESALPCNVLSAENKTREASQVKILAEALISRKIRKKYAEALSKSPCGRRMFSWDSRDKGCLPELHAQWEAH